MNSLIYIFQTVHLRLNYKTGRVKHFVLWSPANAKAAGSAKNCAAV